MFLKLMKIAHIENINAATKIPIINVNNNTSPKNLKLSVRLLAKVTESVPIGS